METTYRFTSLVLLWPIQNEVKVTTNTTTHQTNYQYHHTKSERSHINSLRENANIKVSALQGQFGKQTQH